MSLLTVLCQLPFLRGRAEISCDGQRPYTHRCLGFHGIFEPLFWCRSESSEFTRNAICPAGAPKLHTAGSLHTLLFSKFEFHPTAVPTQIALLLRAGSGGSLSRSLPHTRTRTHTMNIDIPDLLRALGVDERADDTGGKVVQGECETVRANTHRRLHFVRLTSLLFSGNLGLSTQRVTNSVREASLL